MKNYLMLAMGVVLSMPVAFGQAKPKKNTAVSPAPPAVETAICSVACDNMITTVTYKKKSDKNDNGIRAISIPVLVTTKKPVATSINLWLLPSHAKTNPHLVYASIPITEEMYVMRSQKDSSVWLANAVCNVQLTPLDTLESSESIIIVKQNDLSAFVTVNVINPAEKALIKRTTAPVKGDGLTIGTEPVPGQPKDSTPATAAVVKNSSKKCHYKLDNKSSFIDANADKEIIRLDTLRFTIYRDKLNLTEDTIVHLKINKGLFPYEVKTQTDTIIFNKDKWQSNKENYFKETYLIIENRGIGFNNDDLGASAYLTIDCDTKSSHAIQLKKSVFIPEVPFWAEIGTNFDLIDKLQLQNVYGGIFMFEKDIIRFKNARQKRISFTGGVYETKSTSLSTSSDSGFIYRNNSSYIQTPQGYPYFRDTGSVSITSDVTSIGIFFSPHVRMDRRYSDDNGFHWYVSFYQEMLWQRVHSSFDYSKTGLATTSYLANPNDLNKINFKETSLSNDYRSHYFGFGVPVYIRDYDRDNRWKFSFYLNSVIGLSSQKFIALQKPLESDNKKFKIPGNPVNPLYNTFGEPKKSWNPFYLFQFRLNEDKIGISFTGEIRGFVMKGTKPIINLSLSKKFDIASFYNAITKSPSASATERVLAEEAKEGKQVVQSASQ